MQTVKRDPGGEIFHLLGTKPYVGMIGDDHNCLSSYSAWLKQPEFGTLKIKPAKTD